MRKSGYILLALTFLILSCSWLVADITVTIGSGTSTQMQPFGAWYGFERSASIYTSAEIGNFGMITHLAWYVDTAKSTSIPTKIYLKTTTSATLTASTWATMISGATEVYNANRTFTPIGWLSIDISNFLYSSNNLLVLCETNFGGSGSGTSSYPKFRYSSVSNTHQYWQRDNSVPTGNGFINSNRPNIKITLNEPPVNPSSFSALPISQNQINLSWVKNAANNNVMVAYNTSDSFGNPVLGNSYSAGNTLTGGGTVLYNGADTSYSHMNLIENTTYYYKAWSVTSNQYSQGVATNSTTNSAPISSFPWTETFETSSPSRSGWTQIQETGTKTWSYATGAGAGSITTAHGGTLNARFTSSYGGPFITKLVSPILNLSSLNEAAVTFWYGQQLWISDQNELKVYYRTSPVSAWVQLAHYTANVSAWTQASLDLPNLSSTYQIAFEGIDKYGYANVLDDITVAAPNPIPAVSELSLNFGYTDITTGSQARQFSVYNIGTGVLTLQKPYINSGDASQFELEDNNVYPINLSANQSITFNVFFSPTATGAKSSYLVLQDNLGSKAYYVIPLSGHALHVRFQDSFEDNANFSLSLTNWTQYDGDGKTTYGISNTTFTNQNYTGSYIAFNPSATTPALAGAWNAQSGAKYAACFSATTPPNNDWMISPPISFGQNPRIAFWAKSLTSAYGFERFKVMYSTTGNSVASFTNYLAGSAAEYVEAPISWTLFEYTLPPECANVSAYIAIQCVSNDAFVFMVDNFVAGDYGLPQFGVDPVSYTFPDFYINYSRTQQITVFNAGGGTMQIVSGGITISGSPYIKLYDLPTLPVTLNATESISFTVGYNSSEGGVHSAVISITDNLSKAVNTVSINGTTTDNTITQKPYIEGFEPYMEDVVYYQVNGWVNRDNDLDGYNWLLLNDPAQAKSGNWCAASVSWVPDSAKQHSVNPDQFLTSIDESNAFKGLKTTAKHSGRGALTPDNWLISPPITIERGDSLSYWVGSYSAIDYAEHYSLLISTTTPDPLQFTEILYEETLASAAWAYRAFELDEYQGQTVYFAFRHYGSTDMLALKIDDFKVKSYNTEAYQDYVGDPVEGDNYFILTMNPIQDEINEIPLEVIIEAWLPQASNVLVSGYVGFANPLVFVTNAGLTIRVEGVDLVGATVRIFHNLGYAPLHMGYRNLTGNFSYISSSMAEIWNSTQVKFTLPSAKAGEGMEFVFPNTQDGTLPVELSHFSANLSSDNVVQIIWVTQSETNLVGYRVYRNTTANFAEATVLEGFIAATNTSQMQTYLFTDFEAYGPNTYYYWLEHLEMDGSSVLHGPVVVVLSTGDGQAPTPPIQKGIASVFPNPFNPDTSIRFGLSENAEYSLKIYNQKGQLVRNLAQGTLNRGYHTQLWNGRDNNGSQCASGVYFVHFNSGKDSFSRKIMMVK